MLLGTCPGCSENAVIQSGATTFVNGIASGVAATLIARLFPKPGP
jgi:hypothetical protein